MPLNKIVLDSIDLSGDTLCSAWVNFNGTGTVAIRDSYNVSSITDNGAGKYSVNFLNALDNTGYAVSLGVSGGGANTTWPLSAANYTGSGFVAPTTSKFDIATANITGGLADFEYVYAAVFGGKA